MKFLIENAILALLVSSAYLVIHSTVSCNKISIPDLPDDQYAYWLREQPDSIIKKFQQICTELSEKDENFNKLLNNLAFEHVTESDIYQDPSKLKSICNDISRLQQFCWGYESDTNQCLKMYRMPSCQNSTDRNEAIRVKSQWFDAVDFGFVRKHRREMSNYCSAISDSQYKQSSTLKCTKDFGFCQASNIVIDFLHLSHSTVQDGNFLRPGDIAGWNCNLDDKISQSRQERLKSVETWNSELRNYEIISEADKNCDTTIHKPAFIIKSGNATNIYQHFNDLISLYATMHMSNSIGWDNHVVLWNTETHRSNMKGLWSAISKKSPDSLTDFKNQRVCFDNLALSFVPNFFNGTQHENVAIGCSGSGLFRGFRNLVLHRLKIKQEPVGSSNEMPVRISVLEHDAITNINELLSFLDEKLRKSSRVVMNRLDDFRTDSFNISDQLRIIHNTDLLLVTKGPEIGYSLYLPDWAGVLELHNENSDLYKDISRLSRVKNFRNQGNKLIREPEDNYKKNKIYSFDKDEVFRLVTRTIKKVEERRNRFFEKKMKNPQASSPTVSTDREKITGELPANVSGLTSATATRKPKTTTRKPTTTTRKPTTTTTRKPTTTTRKPTTTTTRKPTTTTRKPPSTTTSKPSTTPAPKPSSTTTSKPSTTPAPRPTTTPVPITTTPIILCSTTTTTATTPSPTETTSMLPPSTTTTSTTIPTSTKQEPTTTESASISGEPLTPATAAIEPNLSASRSQTTQHTNDSNQLETNPSTMDNRAASQINIMFRGKVTRDPNTIQEHRTGRTMEKMSTNSAYYDAEQKTEKKEGTLNGMIRDKSHTDGQTDGHTAGHTDSYTESHTNGYTAGPTDGPTDGHTDGYTDGHAEL